MRIYADNPVDLFKALADQTRIRIVRLLSSRPLCVCHIVDALAEPQYKVSRHLSILKRAGLVTDRRMGTWMHYSVPRDLSPLAKEALKAIVCCCRQEVYEQDDARLAASKPRVPKRIRLELDETCCFILTPDAATNKETP